MNATAAAFVRAKANAFADEHGSIDPDTGSLEFGRGVSAHAKEDHYHNLMELADELDDLEAPAATVGTPGLISVDVTALAQLLQALVGPEHHIREMQAMRRLHKQGYPNPIEILLDQVNAWAEADAKKGGAA